MRAVFFYCLLTIIISIWSHMFGCASRSKNTENTASTQDERVLRSGQPGKVKPLTKDSFFVKTAPGGSQESQDATSEPGVVDGQVHYEADTEESLGSTSDLEKSGSKKKDAPPPPPPTY